MQATAKNLRVSARKMGLVAALVRGRSVADATVILEHTPKAAAKDLLKVVKSAAANAENNHKSALERLEITEINVSNAGMMKRFRAAWRGVAHPYRKRMSHVTVKVAEVKE